MSEPVIEQLGMLKPSNAGLDRDAMLYAAGRASARPRRIWPTLAGVLAITQCLMLFVIFNGNRLLDAPPATNMTQRPEVPAETSPAVSIYARALRTADPEALPPTVAMVAVSPDEPIWTIKSISSVVID